MLKMYIPKIQRIKTNINSNTSIFFKKNFKKKMKER